MVGAMVFVMLLMVAVSVVVCVLTRRRRSTDKWNPEASAISEQQLAEGSQRRVVSGTHSTGTGECVSAKLRCILASEVPQFTLAKYYSFLHLTVMIGK